MTVWLGQTDYFDLSVYCPFSVAAVICHLIDNPLSPLVRSVVVVR